MPERTARAAAARPRSRTTSRVSRSTSSPEAPFLRFFALGGLGEIGKNMYLFEYGDDILVVDCGLMFPDEDMFGIDFVVPDVTYLREHRDHVRAVVNGARLIPFLDCLRIR